MYYVTRDSKNAHKNIINNALDCQTTLINIFSTIDLSYLVYNNNYVDVFLPFGNRIQL